MVETQANNFAECVPIMETRSPWSTPTQSEIGEAEAALNNQVKGVGGVQDNKLVDDLFDLGGGGGGPTHHLIRELGDGEPSLDANVDGGLDNQRLETADSVFYKNESGMTSRQNSRNVDNMDNGGSAGNAARAKRRGSKSPDRKPGDAKTANSRRLSKQTSRADLGLADSPTKAKVSNTKRKASRTSKAPLSAAGSVASEDSRGNKFEDLLDPPPKTNSNKNGKLTKKTAVDHDGFITNGANNGGGSFDPDEGISSATTMGRTLSTAATDFTSSSGASSQSPTKDCPDSPTKYPDSPTKSPTKRSPRKGFRSRGKDVLQLPKPYNNLKSDMIKRWVKDLHSHRKPGAEDEEEEAFFKSIQFSHALVLKVNQLCKQGLLDRKTLFTFSMYIARFKIPKSEHSKCVTSFYAYARELTAVRDNIENQEQKDMFDLETASWIPPIYPRPQVIERPPTSKPKDPDSYDFKDDQVAKDYRKMWDKYHQMEAMLQQQQASAGKVNPDGEEEEEEEE